MCAFFGVSRVAWLADQARQRRIGLREVPLAAGEEETDEHVGVRLRNAATSQAVPVLVVGDDDPTDWTTGELGDDRCDPFEIDRFRCGEGRGRAVEASVAQDDFRSLRDRTFKDRDG